MEKNCCIPVFTRLCGALIQFLIKTLFPIRSAFVSSKVFHIQLPLQKRQELDTTDFQDKSHYLTSIDSPKKRGKCAQLFSKNQAANQRET